VSSRRSYDGLVVRAQPIVEAVLRRVVGADDPEYEDLLQSCMENLLGAVRRGSFRGDCPLDRWAATVARNIAIDALRARSRDRRIFLRNESEESLSEKPAMTDGPDHWAEVHEYLSTIEGAMLELGPANARVVYLHDALGYELAEISVMVGSSVAAAQKRLARARRAILVRLRKR
jgi:RNA polymerase sigma factor (sigma-70 family)